VLLKYICGKGQHKELKKRKYEEEKKKMGKFLNALKDLSASVNGKTSEARTVVGAVKEIAAGLTGQDAEGKNLTEVLEFAAQNYDELDLQDKTVTPTTESQEVLADEGYDGLATVTVEAVTSAIDANIVAGNIKKDITILGVTGTYEGGSTPTLINFTVTGGVPNNLPCVAYSNMTWDEFIQTKFNTFGARLNGNDVITSMGNVKLNGVQQTKKMTITENATYELVSGGEI